MLLSTLSRITRKKIQSGFLRLKGIHDRPAQSSEVDFYDYCAQYNVRQPSVD